MRYLTLLTVLFSIALSNGCATAQTTQASAEKPFVTWDKTMIELGAVNRGEKREMDFTFTNTSNEEIKIDLVDACECTTTDYPRGSIAPGEKGKIHAIFDSTEKEEDETISIRVIFFNTDESGNPRIETIKYSFELD